MSTPPTRRTHTAVHSREAALNLRQAAALKNQFTLSALHLYAQLIAGFAFMLYRHVSTPGYMSVMLLFLPLWAGYALSCHLRRKCGLMEKRCGRFAKGLLSLCLFLDAQMSLYAFTEIVRELLPDYNSALISLVSLLCVLPSLRNQNAHALPTLSHFLRWPMAVGFAFCMLGAARQGETGHLFPLFGSGGMKIFSGAWWLCSCLSAALTPLYAHSSAATRSQERKNLHSLLLGLFAAAATALLSAWLMPYYFLARPDTVGSHLLITLRINPSLLSWSCQVCLMLMLLLISLACALSHSRHLLSHALGKPVSGWAGLILVPLPALSTDLAHRLVTLLSPLRTVLMVLALVLLSIAGKNIKEENAA